MRFPRALNKLICGVLVGMFLFARLAVAGYACPQLAAPVAGAAATAMPGCPHMQSASKAPNFNLCAEHCKAGQQSSATVPAPVAMAPAAAVLYLLPALQAQAAASRFCAAPDPLQVTRPPPHAILHCVLRI